MARRTATALLAVLWIFLGTGLLLAQSAPRAGGELKFVVIVSRHGVRPPTWTNEQLASYSSEAWPKWDVPPGNLTSHGATLMKLFGTYYRAQFAKAGLWNSKGCEDAGRLYVWADSKDERCISTGRALATGMFPDCNVKTNAAGPEGQLDPIFSPLGVGIGNPDRELAAAAVMGRLGGHPEALLEAHRPALELLEEVLLGCKPGAKCPPAGLESKTSLLNLSSTSVEVQKGDKPAEMTGPIPTASTLAQNLLLEYVNGMEGKDLGFGRLDEAKLRQIMTLHGVYTEYVRRTPAMGRALASNLMSHVLKSMEQAVGGQAVTGAFGKPGDRVVIVVGHDTNLANIGGMLGMSWLFPGFQPNDTPPGGAMVFELWRQPANGDYEVRTYYTTQTWQQMRKALPLTLEAPPAKAPIFVDGCSQSGEGMPCNWKAFQRKVEGSIDPAMVRP